MAMGRFQYIVCFSPNMSQGNLYFTSDPSTSHSGQMSSVSPSTVWIGWMAYRKRKNRPNGPHLPVWLIQPIVPFPVQHPPYPPCICWGTQEMNSVQNLFVHIDPQSPSRRVGTFSLLRGYIDYCVCVCVCVWLILHAVLVGMEASTLEVPKFG